MNKPGMLKRNKKVGVSDDTVNAVVKTFSEAENAETVAHENKEIALSAIKLWDKQPRNFKLSMDDVIRGSVLEDDDHFTQKEAELEKIMGLALSFQEIGMMNPPVGFDLAGQCVQLIGGQRRTMAKVFSLFHIKEVIEEIGSTAYEVSIDDKAVSNADHVKERLEQTKIEVKAYKRKPDVITLEKMAMADNTQREDLPITDKLKWAISFAELCEGQGRGYTWQDLADALGLTRSPAFDWKKLLLERSDQWVEKAIGKVLQGKMAIKKAFQIAAANPEKRESKYVELTGSPPEDSSGEVRKISVKTSSSVQALKSLILKNSRTKLKDELANVDWDKPSEVKKAFTVFLEDWEKRYGQADS